MARQRIYLCIDLKSFFASVECVERGLDPFAVNLVVADPDRGRGAITLAATPAIKRHGVKSRGRIFEIPEDIEYITAPPRMQLYMDYAVRIYGILLQFVAAEDIHVYSIDEAFLDITPYQKLYHLRARELAQRIMDAIFEQTHITATAGIGTNLFLAKVALDITAKHSASNIGALSEALFRQTLWHHRPLQDFWMIGPGISERLHRLGIDDLYTLAHYPQEPLYRMFGVHARSMIDHAWGVEPTTIQEIKHYVPKANSISNSQILFRDYDKSEAELILKEMVDVNVLSLCEKGLVTDHISLTVGYSDKSRKHAHASRKLSNYTGSCRTLTAAFLRLYHQIVADGQPIRQITIALGNVQKEHFMQYSLFADADTIEKERQLQQTLVHIRTRYGKNAVLKGMNTLEASTQKYRNQTIGGHKAS